MIKKNKIESPLNEGVRVISLTDFVDFIHSTGENRFSHVRKIKKRGVYDPRTDFWLKMRQAIIQHKSSGALDFEIIEKLMRELTDQKKRRNYGLVIDGYHKFVKRFKGQWLTPPRAFLELGNVRLNVNPELGFKIGNRHIVVKLYFKSEAITQSEARIALIAMEHVLTPHCNSTLETEFKLLDVRRNRLFTLPTDKDDLYSLFLMEQDNFIKIYKAV